MIHVRLLCLLLDSNLMHLFSIVLDYFDGTVAFSFSVWLSSFGIISARIGWVALRSAINYCITLLEKVQAIVYIAA